MKNSVNVSRLKLLSFVVTFFVILFVSSCSESDDVPDSSGSSRVPYQCASCIKTPEALPENDASSSGIYKGIFANGSFELNIRNNNDGVNGVVFVNNRRIDLYMLSSEYSKGEFNAVFRGVLDGNKFSMAFRVNEDGSDPKVYDFSLPNGGLISNIVIKETSNSLLESFNGEYYVKMMSQDNGLPDYGDKVDNPFPPTENVLDKGEVNMLISRNNATWYSCSILTGSTALSDHGSIIDGELISERSNKTVATLERDELNNVDFSTRNTPLYMYSIRVR